MELDRVAELALAPVVVLVSVTVREWEREAAAVSEAECSRWVARSPPPGRFLPPTRNIPRRLGSQRLREPVCCGLLSTRRGVREIYTWCVVWASGSTPRRLKRFGSGAFSLH